MAKTNKGLVSYAKAQLGKPYWYGCFGQTGTASLLDSKIRQYPSLYTSARIANCRKQYGVKVHDCVGLIKGYLWCDSNTDTTPKYNAAQDKSANGMYNACKERGYINTMPDIEGVLVFMDGHVGVYIGGGYVIEAKGFSAGVVKTALKSRPWKRWGKCPFITYEATKNTATATKPAKKPATSSQGTTKKENSFLPARGYFKRGDEGENVKKINDFYYNTFPSYEKALKRKKENVKGDYFGENTEAWTREFQKRTGLEVDGFIGKLTLAEMKKYGFKY